MVTCLIGLGANIGSRTATIASAAAQLAAHPQIEQVQLSHAFRTAPAGGPTDQPEFINAGARLETTLAAGQLWQFLQSVEAAYGRQRQQRWGPRTLDLDLLLFGEVVQNDAALALPHPRMAYRRFVLEPAAEVGSDMLHPPTGRTIAGLLEHLNTSPNIVLIAGRTLDFRRQVIREACVRLVAASIDVQVIDGDELQPRLVPDTPSDDTWRLMGYSTASSAGETTHAESATLKLVIDFGGDHFLAASSSIPSGHANKIPALALPGVSTDIAVDEIVAAVQAMRRHSIIAEPLTSRS